MSESFLADRVELHCGNCVDVLATLPDNSLDACVTDPPYHLTSIVKRFGGDNAAPAQFGSDGRYARASAGFMGKVWDGGDVAFRPEVWRAVYRVLKPGAHLVAMGGTRTYHRMACAIEDAGFEIRDTISWLYGSGFPKSHDVSKGIDRAAGAEREIVGLKVDPRYLSPRRNSPNHMDRARGVEGGHGADHDAAILTAPATDAARQWEGWGTALAPACELIVLARKPLSEGTVAGNVLKHGTGALNIDGCRIPAGNVIGQRPWENEQTLCASCAEPAASTTKHPIPETKASIATNSVAPITSVRGAKNLHDTSKPDIGCFDGMRADDTSTNSSTEKFGNSNTAQSRKDLNCTTSTETRATIGLRICSACGATITPKNTDCITRESKTSQPDELQLNDPEINDDLIPNGLSVNAHAAERNIIGSTAKGRWPKNVVHDGSDEVIAGFPDAPGQQYATGPQYERNANVYGKFAGVTPAEPRGDSGSAARFFYTAKADSDDRLGSKHPTVKPLDLMQWLVRLVTPKGGTVLDPFAGTGTTGEAAFREGMRAVLIEAEPEYQADIRRRMKLCLAGPDERIRESIKARGMPIDYGPLFDGLHEAAE